MLASSSRSALNTARAKLHGTAAELSSSQKATARTRPRCVQQRRHASTAQVQKRMFPDHESRGSGSGQRVFQHAREVDFRGTPAATLARYNLKLGKLVDAGLTRSTFAVCKEMKEREVRPDATTYNYMMQACALEGHYKEARAVFEDMVAMGVRPDRQLFHHMLHAARFEESRTIWEILQLMDQSRVSPNESTYEPFVLHYAESDNLELALQYLSDMGQRGLSPTLKTAQGVIRSAGRLGFARLALDLAEGFEATSIRRLDVDVWVECLISCSEALYVDGVMQTWQKVVHELGVMPDEGCCIQVLHTVGRHGISALGLDVLDVLGRMNVKWQEHHFAPVIEAFTRETKIKEALEMLSIIRGHGIDPVTETAHPIYQAIQKDSDGVDAAWAYLEQLHEEGKIVDVTALNVIIQASVAIGDLQRAVGTYKTAADLNVNPDVDSFNFLLSGCIMAEHRELGDRLLAEMKEARVKPDVRTYERLIVLCLTQPIYEDAFFYLEEMKGEGYLPPANVYEAIVRKCVQVGDTRHKLAVDEMLECGYEISPNLKSFMVSGGVHEGPANTPQVDAVPVKISEKERKRERFIGASGEST